MKKRLLHISVWIFVLLLVTNRFNPIFEYCWRISTFGDGSIVSICSIIYFLEGMATASLFLFGTNYTHKNIFILAITLFCTRILILPVFSYDGNWNYLLNSILAHSGGFLGILVSMVLVKKYKNIATWLIGFVFLSFVVLHLYVKIKL